MRARTHHLVMAITVTTRCVHFVHVVFTPRTAAAICTHNHKEHESVFVRRAHKKHDAFVHHSSVIEFIMSRHMCAHLLAPSPEIGCAGARRTYIPRMSMGQ